LPKTKLILFEQRVFSSVLPPLTEEAPLFVFLSAYLAECLGHFDFKTLLTSSSAFLQESKFSVPGLPTGLMCGVGTSKIFFGTKEFCALLFFSSHHSSSWVPTSSAKVFFQEARVQYRTLAACQNEYYPQGFQPVEGF
jgi:hypothetical protein